ncbi:MAG: amidohydrolase family protein [Bacteroidota bacterium]
MDRKQFLTTGILGLGATLSLPEQLLGQENKKAKSVKKIITIEEHFVLKSISQKVTRFYTRQNGGIPLNNPVQKELMAIVLPTNDAIEDLGERRLKFMDESGIDIQVLSYGAGSPQNINDKSLAIELCKEANSTLSDLIKLHPTRFAGFAILPVADPKAAAEELERAVKELGLKGAMLSGTFNGRFFDEPEFLPIFEKAEALNVPLYMHPAIIPKNIAEYYYKSENWSPVSAAMFATAGYGWHLDSGISVVRLIASGLFDKFPKLILISGHWGELVPFYLNRLDDQLGKTLNLKRKISDYYKSNIYITPSGLFSESQLQFAIAEMGADRIIYSGDYPFLIDKNTRKFLDNASISKEDKEKIGYKNAEKLLTL